MLFRIRKQVFSLHDINTIHSNIIANKNDSNFTCNELMTPLAMLDNLPATFVTPSRTPSLMSYKLGAA